MPHQTGNSNNHFLPDFTFTSTWNCFSQLSAMLGPTFLATCATASMHDPNTHAFFHFSKRKYYMEDTSNSRLQIRMTTDCLKSWITLVCSFFIQICPRSKIIQLHLTIFKFVQVGFFPENPLSFTPSGVKGLFLTVLIPWPVIVSFTAHALMQH